MSQTNSKDGFDTSFISHHSPYLIHGGGACFWIAWTQGCEQGYKLCLFCDLSALCTSYADKELTNSLKWCFCCSKIPRSSQYASPCTYPCLDHYWWKVHHTGTCLDYGPMEQHRLLHLVSELKQRFYEDFGGGLSNESIIGLEPVSIVHYTRPGSSIKQPTPNYWLQMPCKYGCCFPPK